MPNIKPLTIMITPKQIKQLSEILEEINETLTLDAKKLRTTLSIGRITKDTTSHYVQAHVNGEVFVLSPYIKLTTTGKIDIVRPNSGRAYPDRLLTRALIKFTVSSARLRIPIGEFTKEWLENALRCSDFRNAAQESY